MSCPWISHCAGGGVVTYRLPRSTILGTVLADFCHLGGELWLDTFSKEEDTRINYRMLVYCWSADHDAVTSETHEVLLEVAVCMYNNSKQSSIISYEAYWSARVQVIRRGMPKAGLIDGS